MAEPLARLPGRLYCVGPLVLDWLVFDSTDEQRFPGGNALIFAVTAARQGAAVSLVGQIGNDRAGQSLNRELQAAGVDRDHLRAVEGLRTKVAELRVEPDGSWRWVRSTPRRFPYLGAEQLLAIDPGGAHLHVAGLPPLLRAAPDATIEGLRHWRERGGSVSAGLARFGHDERAALMRVLEPRDLLFCTADELALLVDVALPLPGERPPMPFERCVVTFGAAGATALWDGLRFHRDAPHPPDERVISTVGAGDVLSGVFVARLLAGRSVEQALADGVELATATVSGLFWRSSVLH